MVDFIYIYIGMWIVDPHVSKIRLRDFWFRADIYQIGHKAKCIDVSRFGAS